MGGGVGEVYGVKLIGLLCCVVYICFDGVLFLFDIGGVWLYEVNVGFIVIFEIMCVILDVCVVGVLVIVLIGSGNGVFGGMGIVVCCCGMVIMFEEGWLLLFGLEVIEIVCGVEEFDFCDCVLVWCVMGGKYCYLIDQVQVLVFDVIEVFV